MCCFIFRLNFTELITDNKSNLINGKYVNSDVMNFNYTLDDMVYIDVVEIIILSLLYKVYM